MNSLRFLSLTLPLLMLALAASPSAHSQTAATAMTRHVPSAMAAPQTPSAQWPLQAGAELSMVELQSLVSKRATALQLMTGMQQSLNDSAKTVAGNIGGGSGNTAGCKTCVRRVTTR